MIWKSNLFEKQHFSKFIEKIRKYQLVFLCDLWMWWCRDMGMNFRDGINTIRIRLNRGNWSINIGYKKRINYDVNDVINFVLTIHPLLHHMPAEESYLISQMKYAKIMLKKFRMEDCKPMLTTVETRLMHHLAWMIPFNTLLSVNWQPHQSVLY